MSHNDRLDLEAEAEAMRAFLPASFGKQSRELNVTSQIESTRRVPARPPRPPRPPPRQDRAEENSPDSGRDSADRSGPNSDSDSGSDDEDEEDRFPVTHELVFKTHDRAVTSISVDPSGSRFVTGSLDGTVKLYDFASMVPNTLRAFKSVDPGQAKPASSSVLSAASGESHPIHRVVFGPHSSAAFLCVSAHPQARVMSRDGQVLVEFVKGDMYLRDMHNTKGHISEITTGAWHPADRNVCLTGGTDSTVRIWDVNSKRGQKDVIVFKSRAAGSAGRTRITTAAWPSQAQGGANLIVAAALDGSLVMWDGAGPFTRPAGEVRDAHAAGTWTSGLDVSPDGRMVVTRGGDGLIKLWDTRKLTGALVTVPHASTADHHPSSGIRYGPGGASILTGSATGDLHILNAGNLRAEHVASITPGSALVAVDWHAGLNQILTGSANGQTRVLYAPGRSSRGAVDIMSRPAKRRHVDDDSSRTTDQSLAFSEDAIVAPGARRGGAGASGRRGQATKDVRRPQMQQQTPFMRTQPDSKHVAQNIPLARMLHEDPREALLKYAEIAQRDPIFTGVWKETQPVTQYADVSDDDDEGGPEKKRAKK